MTDDATTTPPPGGQPQALTDDVEATEIEGEIRAHHQPALHVGKSCPTGGCCSCGAEGGCETGTVLKMLDEARSEVMRLQDNDSAYDVGYQRADAAAGVALDRLRQERDEARARADHFEALARDQQRLNVEMLVSLERGLAQLEASEAECARLRDDCAALLKILDATYDGPLGRFTRDRIGKEIDAALDATLRHPERIRQAQRLPRSRASLDELRRTGQGQLGRPPAGEEYATKTCDHPEMRDRQRVAPTTFRAVCWCGRNYACPTCGFGALSLSHECAPPAPADQARQEGADDE